MSGSALKLFMMSFMVLDHVGRFLPDEAQLIFHTLTRCVMPLFAFMAVEGFRHTSSIRKYLTRLGFASLGMAMGNHLINEYIVRKNHYYISNNVFLTMFLGCLTLYSLTSTPKPQNVIQYVIAAVAIAVGVLYAEGGMMVIPFMLITHLSQERTKLRNILYLLLSAVLAAIAYMQYRTDINPLATMLMRSDFLFIMALPLLYLYNGERGIVPKYLFYVFYPAHLWVISLIAWMIQK